VLLQSLQGFTQLATNLYDVRKAAKVAHLEKGPSLTAAEPHIVFELFQVVIVLVVPWFCSGKVSERWAVVLATPVATIHL